jgi:serine/threonine protein kinase
MSSLSDAAVERLRVAAHWPEFPSDRYTITEEIGRGGMGTVYAAIDEVLGRQVAIKVLSLVGSAAAELRLAAESRVLARLEHPGIVPVHDAGRLRDGRPFYVMKRVQARTLTEHLPDHRDLGERLRIFERICEATAFAHARRILHRDLKPDNIMIGAFGEVMVMDWGVAKALDESLFGERHRHASPGAADQSSIRPTEHGTVLGTHGFMAPEQARGDTESLDERADVYSLGAILLTLLTAHRPSALRVPAPLRSVCARAMASDRGDRYASAAELGEEIARFRAGQAVRAHRETALEKASRIAKLYRMPILLVLTYVVMRAVVALVAGW